MIAPKKSFGQHFLRDDHAIRTIIAEIAWDLGEKIVEVGPGQGALTEHIYAYLVARSEAQRLILVEADADLLPTLHERFSGATIVHADAAQVNWGDITARAPWVLVGNLPYNAGTAIINKAFWGDHPPRHAVVMLQKEVGERILAHPPHMSALGVAMQLQAQGKRVCTVKPGSFSPPPKVDSLVLTLAHAPMGDALTLAHAMEMARAGFAHPRKQVWRTLADAGWGAKEELGKRLVTLGYSPMARAQEIAPQDWIRLASA